MLRPVDFGLRHATERVPAERVPAERGLALQCMPPPAGRAFAGEVEDLQQVVGNLRDTACKWTRHEVRVSATTVAVAGAAFPRQQGASA